MGICSLVLKGHGFSRAVECSKSVALATQKFRFGTILTHFPRGLKPQSPYPDVAAQLKLCPFKAACVQLKPCPSKPPAAELKLCRFQTIHNVIPGFERARLQPCRRNRLSQLALATEGPHLSRTRISGAIRILYGRICQSFVQRITQECIKHAVRSHPHLECDDPKSRAARFLWNSRSSLLARRKNPP